MIRRTARILSWTASIVAAALIAAGAAFVVRLSQGPIALDSLTPYVERALAGEDGRLAVSIGSLVLSWTDDMDTDGGILDLRALQVRATSAEGAPIATVPEMGIGFSLRELLLGRLAPTRLDLIRPQLTIVRHEDGHYGFDIRDTDAAPASESGTEVTGDLLDTLRRPPDRDRTFGLLTRLTVVGAGLRVQNRELGVAWYASRADIALQRGKDGIEGWARLALDLGAGGPAEVEAMGVYRVRDGSTEASLRLGALELSRLAPLAPALAPLRDVAVPVGGTLAATLDADFRPRHLRFDLNAAAGSVRLPVRAEPYAVRSARIRGDVDLNARRLAVDDLDLTLAEARIGLNGTLMDEPDGPIGEMRMTLAAGGRTAALRATAIPGNGGPRVSAAVENLEPALLAGLAPDLAPLAAAALPVGGTVDLDLDRRFLPRAGRVDLTAGGGRIDLPGLLEGPLDVASARVRAEGNREADRLAVEDLSIDFGGPAIRATARAGTEGDRLAVSAEVTATSVPLDDLHRYWPVALSPNAREWVVGNLSKGIVPEARLTLAGSAPRDNPEAFEPTQVHATIEGENIDVDYFRPLPRVVGVSRVHATTDAKTFTIRTEGGHIDDVKLGDGTIVIHGLGDKESIDIDVPVQGPVRTILSVLDHPPLEYPKRLDMDPKRTSGTADAKLHLQFPLLVDLKVDQIDVGVTAKLHNVGIEKVAAGLDATDGALDLALDVKGMAVKGTAKLDGIPANVEWKESFVSEGRGPRTRVSVKATPGVTDFTRFIPDPAGYAQGPVGTEIVFTVDRRKRLGLTGTLDLGRTTLSIPELGWRKGPGTPATGRFALEFQKDKVSRVTGITIEGGGLKGSGSIDLVPATSALARIQVGELSVGRTSARGELVARDGGYALNVTGESLDVEALLKTLRADDAPAASGAEEKRKPLSISARLGRVVFGEGRQLGQVSADLRNDGTAWHRLDVKGRAGEKGTLSVLYGPQGQRHELAIVAEDAGTVLRMLDISDRVQGGRLQITGTTLEPRPDAPIEGQIEMLDYTVIEAPTLARILNALSLSGLAELVSGKGIQFGRLAGNYRKDGRLLTLRDMRTSGGALGLTLEGEVDLATDVANLHGTIVPIYGINRIIGQIPLLGDALSGGAGQGIFAATWHVRGPLADPQVSVNPLAVLAPGFLRNLFFLGSGGKSPDPSPPRQDAQGGH